MSNTYYENIGINNSITMTPIEIITTTTTSTIVAVVTTLSTTSNATKYAYCGKGLEDFHNR